MKCQNKSNSAVLDKSLLCLWLGLLFAPLASIASVNLADAPVAVQSASPNVMILLDNSGSMTSGFLPEGLGGYDSATKQSDGTYIPGNIPWCAHKSFYSSTFNKQYFDPNILYPLPYKPDNTQYPNATYTSAYINPFDTAHSTQWAIATGAGINTSGGTVDLSSKYIPYVLTCLTLGAETKAIFSGYISGKTLNVTSTPGFDGLTQTPLAVGMPIVGQSVLQGTVITEVVTSGSVYTINKSQTVGSAKSPTSYFIATGAPSTASLSSFWLAPSNAAGGFAFSVNGNIPPDLTRGVITFTTTAKPKTTTTYTLQAAALNSSGNPFPDAMKIPGPAFFCTYNGTAAELPNGGVFSTVVDNKSNPLPLSTDMNTLTPDMATLRNDNKFTCKNPETTPLAGSYDTQQNFANWFSYYRTRELTIKSVISIAFHNVTNNVRVGLLTINGTGTAGNLNGDNFVNVSDFDATQRNTLFTKLNALVSNNGTPLPNGLQYVGEYFRRAYMGKKTVTDPIVNSCQSNFAIIATDGAWNNDATVYPPSDAPTLTNADTTGKVPTLPNNSNNKSQTILDPIAGVVLTPGSNWPRPYYDATKSTNTLSDVAMYYWATDLRPDGAAGCSVTSGSATINICTNNVQTSPTSPDPANWQHLSVYAIGLGISGYLKYPGDFSALKSGTKDWPSVAGGGSSDGSISAIDDLWHATLNGHGEYYSANDVSQIQTSLNSALNSVIARSVVGNSVVFATPQISTVSSGTDNATFLSSYNSADWTGDLQAFPVLATKNTTANLDAGSIDTTSPLWPNQNSGDPTSAQAQYLLDAKVAADNSTTKTSRYMVTHKGGNGNSQGIAFQASSTVTVGTKTSTLQSILGNNVVEYFRGVRTYEDGKTFRTRTHLLGDIVNAEPAVVLPPYRSYYDKCYANPVSGTCTNTFKSSQQNRTRVIFQGANDGMLHAFNAALSSDSTNYGNRGQENWAYIPNLVLGKMIGTLNSSPANIAYSHNFFVDGSPVVGDVDFNNTDGVTGNPDWRTILVGGLGKGGRGYYALDVTTPLATSESDAANKVLWEFPNNTATNLNMGYSFGRPAIVKTSGNGWVVLVPSGYNNGTASGDSGGDGHGHLFVLNAKTGALIADISTSSDGGSGANASNLGHISAHVSSNSTDATVDYAYGVTLSGQIWRFNLMESVKDSMGTSYSDHLGSGSRTSLRPTWVATLKDGSGNPQPITSEPEIATITIDGSPKRFIFVTTGQYLSKDDAKNTQTQSAYGFIDDLNIVQNSTPIYDNPRALTLSSGANLLLQQTFQASDASAAQRTLTGKTDSVGNTTVGKTVDFAGGQTGWYIDLPSSGERVVSRPVLIPPGALIFNSNAPSADICLPGGTTWLNVFEYKNGGTLSGLNWASSVQPNSAVGGGTLGVSVFQGQDGRIGFQIPGQPTTFLPQSTSQPPSHRVSWREIPEQ